jgi:hypothetical protein
MHPIVVMGRERYSIEYQGESPEHAMVDAVCEILKQALFYMRKKPVGRKGECHA